MLHAAADDSTVWPLGVTAVRIDGGLRAVFVNCGPRGRGYAGAIISA